MEVWLAKTIKNVNVVGGRLRLISKLSVAILEFTLSFVVTLECKFVKCVALRLSTVI